jgi:hypothetical protein
MKMKYMRVLFLGITQIRERYPKNFIQSDEQRFRIVNLVGPTYIDIRINGTAFDKSGNLWVTNSRIKNGLKVLKTTVNGKVMPWMDFKITDNNFGTIAIDKMEQNGFQPIAMVGFNESTNTFKKITAGSDGKFTVFKC